MSERRNIIDIQKKIPEDEHSSEDSNEGKPNIDYGFAISPQKLESIMGKYKY